MDWRGEWNLALLALLVATTDLYPAPDEGERAAETSDCDDVDVRHDD